MRNFTPRMVAVATTPAPLAEPISVAEIRRLGFEYTEVSQFDLTNLAAFDPKTGRTRKDGHGRVQVRDAAHYAPKESVERYRVQMSQSQFPPIVLSSDAWIVDGNTRIESSLANKQKFFPALVLDRAWAGASTKVQAEMEALAATLNSNGGIQLTAKEARVVASKLIRLGWRTEQIGRAVGVKASGVSLIHKEVNATDKLRRTGLDPEKGFNVAALRALGDKAAQALNDVPFRDLATLARDAGLRQAEIVALAKTAKDAGSDEGAIKHLSEQRTELGDRIAEHGLTGNSHPPLSQLLRQHLGFVTKYDGHEQDLLETNPEVSGKHIGAIETSIKVLHTLLDMQR